MSALVLVTATDTRPARLAEFRLAARRIATLWGAETRMVAVDSGEDIAQAVESHPGLDHLALVCHGWPDRLLARGRGVRVGRQAPPGTISVEYLARLLSGVAEERLHVALACCSCAADPGLSRWLPGGASYSPGGASSLAAHLYRWLRHHSIRATVLGHATAGHTTRNPALREWSARGEGLSRLDAHQGEGAWRDSRQRAAWVAWCSEVVGGAQRAERILAGV